MERWSSLALMYRPPYYMPAPAPQASAANAGYYNMHHRAVMSFPRIDITHDKQMNRAGMYQAAAPYGNGQHVVPPNNGGWASAGHHAGRSRETLELFPLRPTFALPDDKARGAASPTPSAAAGSFSGWESESMAERPNSNAEAPMPFYDFFGMQSVGR
jgi:hypothetical protein